MIELYKQSKLGGRMRHIPEKWSQMIYYFISHFAPLPHVPKITKFKKIIISKRKYSLSEGNFSPIWINTLGHLLLDTMDDSPVWFTMLTDNISSNTTPHMVIPFSLVPIYLQEKIQERERKRIQTETKKFQAQSQT